MNPQISSPQNPNFTFDDALLCNEQILDQKDHIFTNFELDLSWEKQELSTLFSKQNNNQYPDGDLTNNRFLMGLRKESLDWIVRVSTHYRFAAMTTVLAVNCFDRFLLTRNFQRDTPWMNQLAAVACLSLASKVEETQTPLLIDLQVEGSKFLFESKTIMRMESLVLDSLQWKMNPVTPLSFIDYFVRRLGLTANGQCSKFVEKCERIVLAVINDSRSLVYLPSVIAAATMALVIKEVDPDNAFDYLSGLNDFLEISEERVNDCVEFILEVFNNDGGSCFISQKRKYHLVAPASPNGVIDSYFSSDNSNDSWAVSSSSPEPLLKKIRGHDEVGQLYGLAGNIN